MVDRRTLNRVVAGGLVLWAGLATPGAAEAPLAALSALQPGQWELRETGGGQSKSLCLGDPRLLLQIRHGAQQCTRFTIANDSRIATVQYSCPGAGHGRTTLRVETARLVQIETQGVADKSPFVMQFEGRRVGACTSPSGSLAPQARRPEKPMRLGIR